MNVLLIKDKNGNFIHIPAIRGKSFTYDDFTEEQLNGLRGKDGKDGQDYVLTEGDKREIANIIKTDYDQELLDILGGG